jgi:hypothetical protein
MKHSRSFNPKEFNTGHDADEKPNSDQKGSLEAVASF